MKSKGYILEEVNLNPNDSVDKIQKIPYSDSADRSQWEYYKELLGKNAPQDFTDFCNLKYSDQWDSFKHYVKSIQSDELTALAGFELYKNTSAEIDYTFIGETSQNGIKVTGKSHHYIARTIGSIKQRRNGVSVSDALHTIKYPTRIDPVIVTPKGRSQRFIGEGSSVTINPDTGVLIQVNPVKSKKSKEIVK